MKHFLLMLLSSIGFLVSLFLITSSAVNGQTEFKEYVSEPLGIKLQIPSQWEIYVDVEKKDPENCFGDDIYTCFTEFRNDDLVSGNHSFTTMLTKYSFNGSLKDFITSRYNFLSTVPIEFTFLDDKEIMFKNIPAWQMEYTAGSAVNTMKVIGIFTKVNNTFYGLSYSARESDYSKYLPEALNVLNTIEFIPSKIPEVKRPSFLD
jgi:hypothetical protein